MSECSHNCSSCGVQGCSSRIEKLKNEKSKIKHCIAIVSGKGGVGKSFVTSLIASSLNKLGYKVGVLDGDITGPSILKAYGIHERAYGDKEGHIYPAITKSGIKMISSNMLVENENDPIIWRGGLITTLLGQFYKDVLWEELDYLLIDMPPGTSDVTLTTFQSIPLDGIIVVTSPQDLVSLIVEKAINMANTMNINILGLVENMSYVECPNCKEKIFLYGEGTTNKLALSLGIELLAKLPINPLNAEKIDKGEVEDIKMNEIDKVVEKIILMEK